VSGTGSLETIVTRCPVAEDGLAFHDYATASNVVEFTFCDWSASHSWPQLHACWDGSIFCCIHEPELAQDVCASSGDAAFPYHATFGTANGFSINAG